MGRIIWNSRIVLEFDDSDKERITELCNLMGIQYIFEKENMIIFPALSGKTIILRSLGQHEGLQEFIKGIEVPLKNEGATVVIDNGFTDRATLEYLEADILVAISFENRETDLTVFLPFDIRKNSVNVAKQLLRKINLIEEKFSYKIAETWGKIKATKYWSYIFGNSTPTLVLEIAASNLSKETLDGFAKALAEGIIEEIGYEHSNEEANNVLKYLEDLSSKIPCKVLFNQDNKNYEEYEELKVPLLKANHNGLKKMKDRGKKLSSEGKISEKQEKNFKMKQMNYKKSGKQTELTSDHGKSKEESKSKNRIKQVTKVYLPMNPKNNYDSVYQHQGLQYPLMYPSEGPIHQFERPKLDNFKDTKILIPPSFSEEDIIEDEREENRQERSIQEPREIIDEVDNVYDFMYPKSFIDE